MVISLDRPPTPDDLAEVGRCLATCPPAAAPDLGRLVAWAECLGLAGAAAEVLLDPTVSDPVRCRAFAVLSSQVLAGLSVVPRGERAVRRPDHLPVLEPS